MKIFGNPDSSGGVSVSGHPGFRALFIEILFMGIRIYLCKGNYPVADQHFNLADQLDPSVCCGASDLPSSGSAPWLRHLLHFQKYAAALA